MNTRIVIAADHRGFMLKEQLKQCTHINDITVWWYDVGAYTSDRSDYAEYAIHACNELLKDKADYAVLICGTGTGMAIAANRYRYLYAGIAWRPEIAKHGKEDDNMNVLALPADWINYNQAEEIVEAWLTSYFKGGRYAQRISMMDSIG